MTLFNAVHMIFITRKKLVMRTSIHFFVLKESTTLYKALHLN